MRLLTHHDRSKSVAVSAVVNNANTIQYIIHFTCREEEQKIAQMLIKIAHDPRVPSHVTKHTELNIICATNTYLPYFSLCNYLRFLEQNKMWVMVIVCLNKISPEV